MLKVPRPKASAVVATIATLRTNTSPEAVEACVRALVHECAGQARPAASLSSFFRHHGSKVPAEVREMVANRVLQDIGAVGTTLSPAPAPAMEGWLSVTEAARHLRVGKDTLRDRLRQWRFRQRYGWPQWDGHEWYIAPSALDSKTAAAFLSAQPLLEPLSHLLPDWCERQPGACPICGTRSTALSSADTELETKRA